MAYYDERLKELHRQKAQKARLEAMIKELNQQESDIAKKVVELGEIKKKEQLDVDRLEGVSIKALFFSLAGSKEEKLSKERQEAYVAAMKYDAAMRDLGAIQADLKAYQEEFEKMSDCEAEYQNLLEQKKVALKLEGTQKASEILSLEKETTSLEHEITECEEALDVGYKAFELVEKIVEELAEAYKLAKWDTFVDSFLIDIKKQEHIHSAQDYIADLHAELRRFKTELADVEMQSDIKLEIDGFSEFADWFFDNIFIDWDIKTKIENAKKQTEQTRRQITCTINVLKDMRDECAKKRFQLQEELEKLIVEQ